MAPDPLPPWPPNSDSPDPDEHSLSEPSHEEILDRVVSEDMGEEIAGLMQRVRRDEEARYRREHPEEGLRERKRRLTRKTISDAATMMFATRGFENVKVSEVADRVGVSEKTVYNYFATKEAMVLDGADEAVEQMTRALRERKPGESLSEVVVRAISADNERFDDAPDQLMEFVPLFVQMIEDTPSLRAAWLELHHRLADVLRDELAAMAGVDPRDPEPLVAGTALSGLIEVSMASRLRHIAAGRRGDELREAIRSDLERAARVLDTGVWSFEVFARGASAGASAGDLRRQAEEARAEVVAALQQARDAWSQVKRQGKVASDLAREARDAARREARDAARREQRDPRARRGPS